MWQAPRARAGARARSAALDVRALLRRTAARVGEAPLPAVATEKCVDPTDEDLEGVLTRLRQ